MSNGSSQYVPCLRWKQGEYQAVLQLPPEVCDLIVPLIEVPEIGFDFETKSLKKTLDEHIRPFANRVYEKWGRRPCYIDLSLIDAAEGMADGRHPAGFVFDGLRERSVPAIPTFSLKQDTAMREELARASALDGNGVCVRIDLEEFAKADFADRISRFVDSIAAMPSESDLVLDLGAPNFDPVSGFADLIEQLFARIPRLPEWRTVTLLGTSFPSTMAEVGRGLTLRERKEWTLHGAVCDRLSKRSLRTPRFGDYAVAHPQLLQIDPRLVGPAASVRYTTTNGWLIAKGRNVRRNAGDQYHVLCQSIIDSTEFDGVDYSAGDAYIANCAGGSVSTGNLTTWRWVGTNRHITKVTSSLATGSASS